MVKVKICGITNLRDARYSLRAGCDALGFVFYKKSPRYISPEAAAGIIRALPKKILKVGVFVNAPEKAIRSIATDCRLDFLQFHGNESEAFCARFKGKKVIKAFRIKNKIDLNKILKYKTFAYLFDAYRKSSPGGTGKKFNWELLNDRDIIKQPLFLSGGLDPQNVRSAIKKVRPEWVDASSSLEESAGVKNLKKVRDFIKKTKGAGGKKR